MKTGINLLQALLTATLLLACGEAKKKRPEQKSKTAQTMGRMRKLRSKRKRVMPPQTA